MRQHRTIWTLTLIVVLCAATLAFLRQTADTVEDPTADALQRLADDPSMVQHETQSALRAAAVWAEAHGAGSAEAAYLLAMQYQREKNLEGAEAFYRRAALLQPDWPLPLAGLGGLLARHSLGRTREAEQLLRKAIDLDPAAPRPHNDLAVLLRIDGRVEAAEKEAQKALELGPSDLAVHNNYANLLVELGRLEEAERYYRKAIELAPDHPKPYYNLACVYALLGRDAEAISFLREAVSRAGILRREAANDEDFSSIRHLPKFRALVWPDEE